MPVPPFAFEVVLDRAPRLRDERAPPVLRVAGALLDAFQAPVVWMAAEAT